MGSERNEQPSFSCFMWSDVKKQTGKDLLSCEQNTEWRLNAGK